MGMERETGLVEFAREELLRRIESAAKRIVLVSPFLTKPVAESIVVAAESSAAAERKLLTALSERSVRVGVLDAEALIHLHDHDFEIASITNLHAKVSLVDSNWGLVGSGNLTGTGLGGTSGANIELGVTLSPKQLEEAAALVGGWWGDAKPVERKKLGEYAALPKISIAGKTKLGDFGSKLAVPETEGLAEILAEDLVTAASRSYWIKSNYHNYEDETWWRRGWISDWRQASYEVGDLIVLYLSARDDGPATCPAIARATTTCRHDPRWVLEHRDPDAAERWPYVTEISIVDQVPIQNGAPLSVINKSGQSVQGGYCRISRAEFEQLAAAMHA